MVLSILSVIFMGTMFLVMINKAKFARTRRMAFIPLGCMVIELLMTGALTPGLFPALTGVLIFLRLTILGCCAGALRQDAVKAKRRARRLAAVCPMERKTAAVSPICA